MMRRHFSWREAAAVLMVRLLGQCLGGSTRPAAAGRSHGGWLPVREHLLCGAHDALPLRRLQLRGGGERAPRGLVDELGVGVGQLALDALDALADDDVPPVNSPSGLMDLTDDGGVKKAVFVQGWKSPLLSVGDEVSIAVVGREARPHGLVFLNRTEANPLVFRYGKREVVPGLEIAVASMKLGERANFIVRSDYGYGGEVVWKGIAPHSTIEFEIEVLCWGNKDLSDGKGSVLYQVIDSGCGWDQPSPQDEALVTVQARRSTDGKIVVDSGGPQWVSLGGGYACQKSPV